MYKVNVGHIFYTENQLTPGNFYHYFSKDVESKIISSLYRFKKVTLKISIVDTIIQEDFNEKDLYFGSYRKIYNCFHCFHPACSYKTIEHVGLLRVELETNNINEIIYQKVEDNESGFHFHSNSKYKWISTFSDDMIHIPNINEDNINYLFNCDSEYRIYKIEYVTQLVHLKQLPPNWFSKPVPNFNDDSWIRRNTQPSIKPNKNKIYLAEWKNPLKFTFVDADEIMNTTNVSMWLNDEDFYPLFKEFVMFPNLLKR